MKRLIITALLLMIVFTLCTDERYHFIGCVVAIVAVVYNAKFILSLLDTDGE